VEEKKYNAGALFFGFHYVTGEGRKGGGGVYSLLQSAVATPYWARKKKRKEGNTRLEVALPCPYTIGLAKKGGRGVKVRQFSLNR